MENNAESGFPKRRILNTIFKRKWTIVIFLVAMVVVVMGLSYVLPPKYNASAKVLIKPGTEQAPFYPWATAEEVRPTSQLSQSDVMSEIQLMYSRPVLARVVSEVGLTRAPGEAASRGPLLDALSGVSEGISKLFAPPSGAPEMDPATAAIGRLSRKIRVEPITLTNVLQVTYTDKNPRRAARVVNTLLESYIERHIEVHRVSGAALFLEDQAGIYKQQLDEAAADLRSFTGRNDIFDIKHQKTNYLERLATTEINLRNLTGTGGTEDPMEMASASDDELLRSLRGEIIDLELERATLVETYGEDHKAVRDIDRKIEVTKERLGIEIASLRQIYSRDIKEIRAALKGFEWKEAEYDRLNLIVEEARNNYLLYQQKTEEARVQSAMDNQKISSVRVLEKATVPTQPSFPNLPLNFIVSILIGLFGGVGFAFFKEYLDHGLGSVEEVESRFKIPVLASIPQAERAEVVSPRSLEIFLPKLATESDHLWRQIKKADPNLNFRVIVVSSSTKGEGVTTVSSGLARVIAEQSLEQTVCLRCGSLQKHLSEDAQEALSMETMNLSLGRPGRHSDPPSLSNGGSVSTAAVIGTQELTAAFNATRLPNLNLLEMDNLVGEFSLLPLAARVKGIVERLREIGTTAVVIDAPPILHSSEILEIASLGDAVVLVLGAAKTRREVVQRAILSLERAQIRIYGVALNFRVEHIPSFFYRRM
ncbi:MAG: GumC family protein [Candidatus Zixiibacteriota bacterium]